MTKNLIIIGAGGHGRVCADVAIAAGWNVMGFCDLAISLGTEVNTVPVVASNPDQLEEKYMPGDVKIFVALGDNDLRFRMCEWFLQKGYALASLVHSSAILAPSVTIGEGAVLMPGVIANANTSIGRFCIVNTGATIDHDNSLGDGTQICPGVNSAGNVSCGEKSFIGTGSSIIPGISIGKEAIVAAGAVVITDVPDKAKVGGNPAKPLD